MPQLKTLVFANQKGGVGKSAIATQLAFHGVSVGLRVLVLDLDHQRHTTHPIVRSRLATSATISASDLLNAKAPALPEGAFVLIPGDETSSLLERQPEKHNHFANNVAELLRANQDRFDLCVIDTNPNPDIRYGVSMVVADFVISPVVLNQEALEGIATLLSHSRYGVAKVKAALNPKLELIGILPNLVEATPFQKENFAQLAQNYAKWLIELNTSSDKPKFAFIPKRTAIAEAQAAGMPLASMKKTSAREAWIEIKPVLDTILKRIGLEAKDGT